jgi:hypothetical protein
MIREWSIAWLCVYFGCAVPEDDLSQRAQDGDLGCLERSRLATSHANVGAPEIKQQSPRVLCSSRRFD